MKERRVIRRESMTFGCFSKNSIAPELSQIQPFPRILTGHIQCRQTTRPNYDGKDGWTGKEGGGKKAGREEIHRMDSNENR